MFTKSDILPDAIVHDIVADAIESIVHGLVETLDIERAKLIEGNREDAQNALAGHAKGNGLTKALYDLVTERQGREDAEVDRKSTRLNSSHITRSRMPSSA